MEGLIGQVPDVGEEAEIVERSDGTWLVDGQYNFYDFLEYFDMEDLYAEHEDVYKRQYLRCRRKNRKPFDFFSNGFLYDFQNKIIPLEQSKFNRP